MPSAGRSSIILGGIHAFSSSWTRSHRQLCLYLLQGKAPTRLRSTSWATHMGGRRRCRGSRVLCCARACWGPACHSTVLKSLEDASSASRGPCLSVCSLRCVGLPCSCVLCACVVRVAVEVGVFRKGLRTRLWGRGGVWHHSRSFTSNKYGCVSALSVYMEHVPGSPPLLVRAVCDWCATCVPPLVRISYLVNVPASCGVAAEAGAC